MSNADPPSGSEHGPIGCLEALELFYAYLDGETDAQSAADFEQHMSHCLSCYSRVELEGLVTERLEAARSQRASEALRRRIRGLFDDEPEQP
jgi:anti-sigma factor (TIGR02949 family)